MPKQLKVFRFVNKQTTSNTYVIEHIESDNVWLIDIGVFNEIINFLSNKKLVQGVFLTHTHYDHILYIKKLVNNFPNLNIYTSNDGIRYLSSPKLNLSEYHNCPISLETKNTFMLKEGSEIQLFNNIYIKTFETPGHNTDCLTYLMGNYLFSGDSYIPNQKVVTKLRGGDKNENRKSLIKIFDIIDSNTIICSGHGSVYKNNKILSDKYFN